MSSRLLSDRLVFALLVALNLFTKEKTQEVSLLLCKGLISSTGHDLHTGNCMTILKPLCWFKNVIKNVVNWGTCSTSRYYP
ncbi:hypothetical protein M758_11G015500 [Ceratodon purpureus]|nr:hypothetical protein M758_11G015500 [Ceratodon purpureus]